MSSLSQYRFEIPLYFIAPVITQSAGALGHGLDAAALVDRSGVPVLPGTLIQGNLRHSWECFSSLVSSFILDDVDDWLGGKSTDGSPKRGRLIFDEFWRAVTDVDGAVMHHRIRVDPEKATVATGALQIILSPFGAGKEVKFTGGLTAWLQEGETEKLKKYITKGLQYVPSMGAFKGIGFGRIQRIGKVVYDKIEPEKYKIPTVDSTCLGLVIKPDRPICFSRHLKGNNSTSNHEDLNDKSGLDNQFISEDYIPGGALKGAIATFLRGAGKEYDIASPINNKDYPKLSEYIDKIRITNGYPSKNSKCRPLPLPLTVVSVKDNGGKDQFFDVAFMEKPGIIYGQAPTFCIDWKDKIWQLASKRFLLPSKPTRSLSIHTAIDSQSGASTDHQLFSVEAVNPESHCWLANLFLPADIDVKERQELNKEIQDLFSSDLHWLGKTQATAEVVLAGCYCTGRKVDEILWENGARVAITLASQARLLKPGQISKATNSHECLMHAYNENWCEISEGALKLTGFYAAQKLMGGAYWQKRFNKNKIYNPQIFTKAGSVFIFEVEKMDKVNEHLIKWCEHGLPQLSDVSEDWQENPWIGTNGLGEIVVDLEQHTTMAPQLGDEDLPVSHRQWVPLEGLI